MRKVRLRRGYLWLGEIPESIHFLNQEVMTTYPIGRMIESHIENLAGGTDSLRSAALNIMWATGGQGHWAFLGASFEPHPNSLCIVRVGVSADDTGLTPRLAQAVNAQAIASLAERKSPLSGILTFERAVSHPIDSDPKLFELVTDCLIRFVEPRSDSLTDSAISEVFEQIYREWYLLT